MCNEFCKEFKGWCKSFTKIEVLLSILEGILLVLVIVFLVFLIRHFLACKSDDTIYDNIYSTQTSKITTHRLHIITPKTTAAFKTSFSLAPSSECTWKPSEKTTAHTKYYIYDSTTYKKSVNATTPKHNTTKYSEYDEETGGETKPADIAVLENITKSDQYSNEELSTKGDGESTEELWTEQLMYEYGDENYFEPDASDGEEAEDTYKQYVLALVKVNPHRDLTFGCILTIITEVWVVTAASCIQSIEEVDSLDSFVMMEDYGSLRKGRTHVISDVQIHPMFEGVNRSYDVAALKSEDSLMSGSGYAVELPSLIDYFMITVGERFTLLGFGPYRTVDAGPQGKRVHEVSVYTVRSGECAGAGAGVSLRHLFPGAALRAGACGRAALCAGPRWARGAACNYCSGAPLLRGTTLLGVMSDNSQCGVACEPQLYVNIAVLREWLDYVTSTK